jgi:hypothetical protein
MNKVPKCKECQFHKGFALYDYNPVEEHYCQHIECKRVLVKGTHIKSSEYQTSPKWCPLRSK